MIALYRDAGDPLHHILMNIDLEPLLQIRGSPSAADGTGAFTYDDSGAVGLTKRFYRLVFP